MLQILNVYFSSTFTASSSDFAKWKFYSFYINLVDLGTIGLEMSMIHKRKSMARILASIVKVQVSYKTHAVVISCVRASRLS